MSRNIRVFLAVMLLIIHCTGIAGAQADRRIDVNTGGGAMPMATGNRVALLIGNAAYQNVPPLSNPLNDVRAFSQALRDVGFDVIVRENCDLRTMDEAVTDFWNRLKGKEAGLFYYSGHGMQVNGENFLVPVSAAIEKEMDIKYNCFPAQKVLELMDDAKAQTNIVILDACRNNPFKRGSRSAAMGLARMDAVGQMFVAYATDPDKVANDGDPGGNSPYMRHILKNMKTPGLPVEMMFKEVRAGVLEETNQKQRPWELSCLTRNFSFVPAGMAPAQPPTVSDPPQTQTTVTTSEPPHETTVSVPPTPTMSSEPAKKSRWDSMWEAIGWGSKSTPVPNTTPESAPSPATSVSTGSDNSLKARAERGDGQAQYELGVRYFEGREVPKDLIEALRWFKMSADNGVASGQIKLGWMYENGKGVAQDTAEARRWYARAADQGNPFAEKALKNLDGKKSKPAVAKKPKPAKKPTLTANAAAPSSPAPSASVVKPSVKQSAPTPTQPQAKTSQKEDWKQVRKALERELIKGLLQGLNKKK